MLTPDQLRRVLPAPVETRVARFDDRHDPLRDIERAAVKSAGPKRLQEFQAGRHCAHAALTALGSSSAGIERGPAGMPSWPPGVIGSISHTGKLNHGWAVAAVAPTTTFSALGVDVESASPLSEALEARILSPSELARLDPQRLPAGVWAKLAFSCKECAYKAQYPLTGQFLEFHDLELDLQIEPDLPGSEVQHGVFRAVFLRNAGSFRQGASLYGRFAVSPALVLSGIVIPA